MFDGIIDTVIENVADFFVRVWRGISFLWEQFMAVLSLLTEMQLFLFLLFILFFFHLFFQDRLPLLNKYLEDRKKKRKKGRLSADDANQIEESSDKK